MAFYGRRYRRYRRYRRFYRRFGRYARRSYARKYVNGSSRSNVRLKCSVEANFELSSGTAAGPGAVTGICPLYDSSYTGRTALTSPLYRTYCSLYEEVKVVGFKTQISIASVIGGADIPSLQIYTAIDRRHGATEASYTADEIKNSSTYLVSTALNNNVAKITRSCYASDLMEKAQWHDCSLQLNGGVYADSAYAAAGVNPNFFAPALFMCFQSPTLAAAVQVKVNVSTVFYFAFRNPKYGAGANASKVQSLGGVFHDPSDPDGGGDVDDSAMRDVPAAAARGYPDLPPDLPGDFPENDDDAEAAAALSSAPAPLVRPTGSAMGTSASVKPVSKTRRTLVVHSKNV